jgi:hypothetical protein
MKKLIIATSIIFALILSGCNFPGFESETTIDADDAMATEISRILTGTPIQIDVTPPVTEEVIVETEEPEEIETAEPTKEEVIEPTETEEPEESTQTPQPTDTPAPMPTATLASTDPTLNLGDPDWVDQMNNDNNWPTGFSEYTEIEFEDGFLKLTATSDLEGWRITWPKIDNFYLEATLQTPECSGGDHFGLMFRVPADSQAGKGYLFGITCDGYYSLRRWDGNIMYALVNWRFHDSIEMGEDAVNKLGVMARNSSLALYINGQKVQELSDSSYLEGQFGIFVGRTNVDDLTVWVDQIRYWVDP